MRLAATLPLLIAAAGILPPVPILAQPYARLNVPGSELATVLQANRGEFENLWNALLVAWLRARVASADSSARLAALAERVATAEPVALDTHIAAEALGRFRDQPSGRLEVRLRAAVAESLAGVARGQGDAYAADSLYRAALADYRLVGEARRAAWVLGSLGAIALAEGLYLDADSLFTEALSARRAIGDLRMVGNTLYDLGQTNYKLGRYQTARVRLEESRGIRERTGQTAQLGSTLQFLGTTLAALGRPDSAWLCFERGIALTSAAGDSARTLDALANYAMALGDEGHDERAIAVYRRARVIADELERPATRATLEFNLGEDLRRSGRFTEALDHLHAAAELRETLGLETDLAHALNQIGRLWLSIGDPASAHAPLERARAVADSLGDPSLRAMVLVNLSWAAQLGGDVARANRHAADALAAAVAAGDSQRVHDAAAQLGDLAIERGRLAEAEPLLARTLGSGRPGSPEERASDLTRLALARQLGGRLNEAERDLREAIGIAERIGAAEIASGAWLNLGDVAERRGDFAAAFERYFRALDLIDTVRARQRSEAHAITAFASRLGPYEAIVHLLGRLDASSPDSGYAARAFHWAERARARALLEQAAALGAGTVAPRPVSIAEVGPLLPSRRSALLHYSVGDSSTALWVIRTDGWRHYRLAPRREWVALVKTFRVGLAARGGWEAEAFRDAQRRLYRTLVAPAESMLAGVEELVISPDGPLAQLPFEALRAPATRGARWPYLVERFAVSYVPSASLLAAMEREAPQPVIVAVGDPAFGKHGPSGEALRGIGGVAEAAEAPAPPGSPASAPLASLPGAGRELKALEAAGHGRRVVALTGAEATRSRLLRLPELADAAIIHIATHGVAHELEPARSGLWLAAEAGSQTASFVSVPDVLRLRLHASLVTLSACETALGRVERGEGVIGLARAFFAAGARSVLVSQWRVADRATADLMERFYRALLVEGRTRALALADAKRALLRREATRSPHLWAPFVLIGRSGPLE